LAGPVSLLRATIERLFPMFERERVYVVTAAEHAPAVREEASILPAENVIDEPVGRDTAAAVALFAQFIEWRDPGASFCTLPSDHYIDPPAELARALTKAFEVAERGRFVTFGIRPTRAATQYGYLERGPEREAGVFDVLHFREKPDAAAAERLLREGRWLWNSGMFIWRAADILDAVRRHLPAHHAMLESIRPHLGTSGLPQALQVEYSKLPKVSVDYGIMEKVPGAAMIEPAFRWSDLGGWEALRELRPKDADDNVLEGDVAVQDVRRSVVLTDDGHLVAAIGLDHVVIVHTADATLVAPIDRADEIKALVERLRREGRERAL
jgi:mannose-1-phosphate guanylyltransferase